MTLGSSCSPPRQEEIEGKLEGFMVHKKLLILMLLDAYSPGGQGSTEKRERERASQILHTRG